MTWNLSGGASPGALVNPKNGMPAAVGGAGGQGLACAEPLPIYDLALAKVSSTAPIHAVGEAITWTIRV